MAAITLSTALQALLNRKKDLSDVSTDVFIGWCDFINKYLYRQLTNIDPERWIMSQLYTVSASPTTAALPAGFLSMSAVGCGVFMQDPNGNDTSWQLPRTGFGASDTGFYITGSNIVFTGINSAATFRLRYIPSIATLTAIGDSMILYDYYLGYLVDAMDVQYTQWDENPLDNMVADQRFVNSLEDLLSCFRKEFGVIGTPNPLS
jgi:hypothetical protein